MKILKEILSVTLVYTFFCIILLSIINYNDDFGQVLINVLAFFFLCEKSDKISKWLLKNNE